MAGDKALRKQPVRVKTHSTRKKAVITITAVITAALVAAIVIVAGYQPSYRPPPFEPSAVTGVPQPPESVMHTGFDAGGFTFMIAGNKQLQEDGSVRIYLTNPPENEVYLMCEIVDTCGNTLYRSGLLRPGEYVAELPAVESERPVNETVDILIHVYALEQDGFFSAGTVTLGNVLQHNF